MWRRARLLVCWLLFAALPLQGLAATAMALCGPAMEHQQMELATTAHAGSVGAHEHMAMAADAHDHATAMSDHHDDAAAQPDSDPDARTCSVCASCCMGAGLVSKFLPLEFGHISESFAHPVGSDRAAFLTGGLERPPRPFLA